MELKQAAAYPITYDNARQIIEHEGSYITRRWEGTSWILRKRDTDNYEIERHYNSQSWHRSFLTLEEAIKALNIEVTKERTHN